MLVYCGQAVGWIKVKLGVQVGLSLSHILLDGDPAPSPQKAATAPQFSAHIYCGQMAGWVKMSFGTEVGLDPSDVVFYGDPAPLSPQKGAEPPPNFWPMSIVATRLDESKCHLEWR